MSLQGRRENGLEESLYPQGDLQLAKQEDIPTLEGRSVLLFGLLAVVVLLRSAGYSQL